MAKVPLSKSLVSQSTLMQATSDVASESITQTLGSSYEQLNTDTSPKLEVRSLCKTFQHQGKPISVLQNINMHLNSNEFVCIVGASGCGKSTLLNIIAGLVPPSSGQVLVDGEAVPGPGADRGMVFQSYTLFPW